MAIRAVPAFNPGSQVFVKWKLEASTSTSYGFTTELPALTGAAPVLAGLTNIPEVNDDFGTRKGFAAGTRKAVYTADGAVVHEITVELRGPGIDLLAKCMSGSGGLYGGPADVALFVGVSGQYCDVYRFCKCQQIALNFREGGGQELVATVTFWALARETGSILTVSDGEVRDFGEPLFWHDVREFVIDDVDYRHGPLAGLAITLSHQLERKGVRDNLGHDNPLSMVPYELMPHSVQASGEVSLHSQLSDDLYYGAVRARRWGDVTIACSNAPGLPAEDENIKYFNLTLQNVAPVQRRQQSGESGTQVQRTVPIVFDDMTMNGDAPEEPEV